MSDLIDLDNINDVGKEVYSFDTSCNLNSDKFNFVPIGKINKISINEKLPKLNKIRYCTAGVSNKGIIIYGLIYHSGDRNNPGYYTLSGKNGFLSSSKIADVHVTTYRVIDQHSVILITMNSGVHIQIDSKSFHANDSADANELLEELPTFHSTTIASCNLLDLDNDPTYAQETTHISNVQNDAGFSSSLKNTSIASIKSRYISNYTNEIFSECIRIPRHFMIDIANNQLLIMQLKRRNGLYFFTGQILELNQHQILQSAIYKIPPNQSRLILVTQTGIIILSTPHFGKSDFPHTYNSSIVDDFASILDPIFLPKLQYQKFMNQQINKIKQQLIASGTDTGKHFNDAPALINKKSIKRTLHWSIPIFGHQINIWSFNIIFLGIMFLWATFSNQCLWILPQAWIVLISIPIIIFLICCMWETEFHSQTVETNKAIRGSIIGFLILLILNGSMIFNIHHKEVKQSNHILTTAIGTYPTGNNNSNFGDHDPLASNIKITKSNLYGEYSNQRFDFKINNYYYNWQKKGLVLKGYYVINPNTSWTNQWNNISYDDEDSDMSASTDDVSGYSPNNIFISYENNHLEINFAGNANDSQNSSRDSDDGYTSDVNTNGQTYKKGQITNNSNNQQYEKSHINTRPISQNGNNEIPNNKK